MCCTEALRNVDRFPEAARARCSHIPLDPHPASAGAARAFVVDALDAAGTDFAETLALLTSELVTNAVLHARTRLEVGVTEHDGLILVAVGDGDLVQPEQQPYSADRTHGRGMRLVAELAEDHGTTTHADGKSVWFVLRRPEPRREGGE